MGLGRFFGRSPEQGQREQSGRSPEERRHDLAISYLNAESRVNQIRIDLREERIGQNDRGLIKELTRASDELIKEMKALREQGGVTDEDLRAAEEGGIDRLERDNDIHERTIREGITSLQEHLNEAKTVLPANEQEISRLLLAR